MKGSMVKSLITAAVIGGVVTAAVSVSAADFPTRTYILAEPGTTNEDDFFHMLASKFAENVNEMTDGAITIDIKANGQLGNGTDVTSALEMGTLDFNVDSVNVYGAAFPQATISDLPFLFESEEQAIEFTNQDFMQEMFAELETANNVKFLALGNGGFRVTASKKTAIYSTEDYKGLKIRVPDVKAYVDTFSALGANPTPMAWAEVFTSIQQGTVDAMEAPLTTLIGNNFYEVCDYFCMDNHLYNLIAIQCSGTTWNAMSEELQAVMAEAAEKAAADQLAESIALIDGGIEQVEELGVTVIRSEDIDIAGMREACETVYDEMRTSIGEEFFDKCVEWINAN